jgi:hypothetical protein
LIHEFKKSIRGISKSTSGVDETIPKFEEDKNEFPINYLNGKFMPWQNQLAELSNPHVEEFSMDTVKEKKAHTGMKFSGIIGIKR